MLASDAFFDAAAGQLTDFAVVFAWFAGVAFPGAPHFPYGFERASLALIWSDAPCRSAFGTRFRPISYSLA
jgi:hypothetical protein